MFKYIGMGPRGPVYRCPCCGTEISRCDYCEQCGTEDTEYDYEDTAE